MDDSEVLMRFWKMDEERGGAISPIRREVENLKIPKLVLKPRREDDTG